MRAPYTQLYIHLVWATWDRLPLITSELEARLYPAMIAKCKEHRCEALAIGGVQDHVHLLVRFAPTISVADLVKEIKGSSSHLVTHVIATDEFFKWQGAYRAFTVSKNGISSVKSYILSQKDHHQLNTIINELEPSLDTNE
jgi:putative transposase